MTSNMDDRWLRLLPHTSERNLMARKGTVKTTAFILPLRTTSISCFERKSWQPFLTLGENLLAGLCLLPKRKNEEKSFPRKWKKQKLPAATKHGVLVYVSEGKGEVAPIHLKRHLNKRHASLNIWPPVSLNLYPTELCVTWLKHLELGETGCTFCLLIIKQRGPR